MSNVFAEMHLSLAILVNKVRWKMSQIGSFYRILLSLIAILLVASTAQAQYQTNGDAGQTSCQCFEVTPDAQYQSGSVWNVTLIDLSQPFDFTFDIFLGCEDWMGADGMAFVLQPLNLNAGGLGNGIGYGGISPSLAVEFDTFDNSQFGDGAADHIAIQSNGVADHTDPTNNLSGPVFMSSSSANTEDCNWHTTRIVWNPTFQTLLVYFDGVLRTSYTGNIVNNIFGGNPLVYWGWTGSTGDFFGHYQFCISLEPEFTIVNNNACVGVPVQFTESSSASNVITDYAWDFGDGNTGSGQNVSHAYSTSGTFDVDLTITSDGCTETYTDQVTIMPLPTVDLGTDLLVCPGGSVQLNSPNTIGGGTYSWSPNTNLNNSGIASPTSTPTADRTYTLSYTENGCSNTDDINVTLAPQPVANAGTDATVCSGSSVQLSGSGGGSYQWDNAATLNNTGIANPTATPGSNTTYTLTVTDGNNCTDTDYVLITVAPLPTVSANSTTDCATNLGEIVTSGSGGTPPYTFDIGSGPQASGTFSGLTPGNYTVTIVDDLLCADQINVTVDDFSGLTASITSQTNVDCNGNSTGSVTVTASGSTPAYTYSIDGVNFGASGTFSGLAAGNYTVTAQDGNTCTVTIPVVVAEPSVLTVTQGSITDANCGNANGEIQVSGGGGTPPFTFDIGSGAQATGTFSNLIAGSYTVTIVDDNLCSEIINVTVADLSGLSASIGSKTNVDCNGASTGEVTVAAVGGATPYSFDIGNGPQASATFSGLANGPYTVTVLDGNSCSVAVNVSITEPSAIVPSEDQVIDATCGNSNGEIQISASGGTPPFTFDIGSGAQASGTFSNLSAGPYTVTVIDDDLCSETISVTVADLSGPTASIASQTDADCYGAATGEVTIAASGGATPYSFDIGIGPQPTGDFTGLTAGSYTVTVLDDNSCASTVNVTITEPNNITISEDAVTDATCGNANGEVQVSASGGTPPFSFDIGSGPQASGTFSNLSAGSYTITVLDNNLCLETINVTIADQSGLTANIASQTESDCNGASAGSITIGASGGATPYSFDIGSGPQATGVFGSLAAGSYTVTVLDGNASSVTVNVTITEPSVIVPSEDQVIDATCGNSNGEVQASALGGTPPFSFDIGSGPQASGTFSNLSAGLYTISVADDNLCTETINVTVADLSGPTTTIDSQIEVDCNGASTGEVNISAAGGTAQYTFDIGNGPQMTGTFTGLAAGNYSVTVLDDNLCSDLINVVIAEPSAITVAELSVTDATCGNANGDFEVSASGGTPPFTYDIGSGPQAFGTFSNLNAGTYNVAVLDANLCAGSISVVVADQSGLIASIDSQTEVVCFGGSTGSVFITASGGVPPYTFDIGSGPQPTGVFAGLVAGSYIVTVLDGNACSSVLNITITEPVAITATEDAVIDATCGNANAEVQVSASGGTPPFTFDIGSGPQASGTFSNLIAGSFTVTVVDGNLCSETINVTVNDLSGLASTLDSQTNVDCNGALTGELTVSASGGSAPYTFDIGSGPQATGTFIDLAAGSYVVNVEDAIGCTSSVNATITEPAAIVVTEDAVIDATCGNTNGEIQVSASGGTPPFSFDIGAGPQATGLFPGLGAGSYTIMAIDGSSCSSTVAVIVADQSGLSANIDSQTDVDCSGNSNGALNISATGGLPPYSFDIGNGPQAVGDFSGLAPGSYSVTVLDGNGCSSVVNTTITEPAPLVLNEDALIDASCGNANGEVQVSANGGTQPYSFDIGSGPQPAGTFTNLIPGSYTINVLDNNLCSTTINVTIADLSGPAATITSQTEVDCNGAATGEVTITASGGATPYSFDIGNGPQASGNFAGLVAGNYSVTVFDNNSCTSVLNVTITEPAAIILSEDAVIPASCGFANGEVQVSAVGGLPPYFFDIGNGPQSSGTFTGLAAGPYTITVLDVNNCSELISVIIADLGGLTAGIASQTNVDCNGDATGAVSISGTGGTLPYSFDIGNGPQPTGDFTGLMAGTHNVTVTDGNGCTSTINVSIIEPAILDLQTVSVTNLSCGGTPTGEFEVVASGGTGPYEYSIGSTMAQSGLFTGLSGGQYNATVIDDNGCQETTQVDITAPLPMQVSVNVSQFPFCIGQIFNFDIDVVGGSGPYAFEWIEDVNSNITVVSTDSIPSIPAFESGSYFVNVTDASGCTGQSVISQVVVNEPISALVVTPNGSQAAVCEGDVVSIGVSASGGDGTYYYFSMPGHDPISSFPVNYVAESDSIIQIQVEDGCTVEPAQVEVEVTLFAEPDVQFTTADSPSGCQPLEVDFSDATNPPLTNVEWTFAGNSMPVTDPDPIHTFHSSGLFGLTMTGTSANGCLVNRAFENEITVYPKPTADFRPSPSQTGLYDAFIEFTDRSGAGVTDWYWDFADGVSSIEENPTHLFSDTGLFMVSLEVSNSFGCLDTAKQPVEITPEFSFWIPNAFTPDGDSLNDYFSGEGMGINWDMYEMQIFNRWGTLLYSTTDIKKPWDGTYKGKPAEVTGYTYYIRLEEISGFKRRYTGYFTLIR